MHSDCNLQYDVNQRNCHRHVEVQKREMTWCGREIQQRDEYVQDVNVNQQRRRVEGGETVAVGGGQDTA